MRAARTTTSSLNETCLLNKINDMLQDLIPDNFFSVKHSSHALIQNTFHLTATYLTYFHLLLWQAVILNIGIDWDHPFKWLREENIWQENRFHCEVRVWVWISGSLLWVCVSHPTVSGSHPQAATGTTCSHKTQRNGISHTLMDPGLLYPCPSTPLGSMVGGWLRSSLWDQPPSSLVTLTVACGQTRHDIACNQNARSCCVMLLPDLNFVKLVTNLNSCSFRAPIITWKSLREQFANCRWTGRNKGTPTPADNILDVVTERKLLRMFYTLNIW